MANELPVAAGFDTEGLPSAVWPGGETEALTRLERHLERKPLRTGALTLTQHCGVEHKGPPTRVQRGYPL
ncbi:unnamed protein product [Boreogadus saida]